MSGGHDLGDSFRRLIRQSGPITVARYMGEGNAHYYSTRDPLGQAGDFITAPEISQMFGEMIGLWCADLWQRAGRPADLAYVELGPGRGTLAADALRAMARHGLCPPVHFVEGSSALAALQQQAVPQALIHDSLGDVPEDVPMVLVANEFLDALPVRQLVRTQRSWRERMVALDDADRFMFVAGDQPMDDAVPEARRQAEPGTIIETCPGAAAVAQEIGRRLREHGGAALLIDYGYLEPATGSTLQAVRAHRKVDPLASPGAADLTAHVDFAALAEAAEQGGAGRVFTATQGAFLERLGITARANALVAAQPERRAQVAGEHRRLCAPDEMGELFKVMALVAPGWPPPAGFA
ncbi:class I SAM-dependent methyltransferase [Porphyrobacter sp. GA68]|uniref:class I SAM-dependent methyltransferase n=1 Tax=Porphyrobacter sp. GA68 TaxID=2883480 RepID=UPI001D19019C|nr:SAM-dependent methyltransferase [Porphyrobacter sp. GA68]